MGYGSRALLAGGVGLAVSFLVACGGNSGLLSSDQATNLNSQLAALSSAVADGNCGAAASAARSFSNGVANLPSTVNTTLVQNLGQGAQTVSQLAAEQCQSATTSSSSDTTSSTTPSTTTTTPTTTTPTTTTTTTPTTTSTTTTSSTSTATTTTSSGTTSTAPSGGAGLGSGGGAGAGNGNGNGGSGP
jgi:hypothetical protein